MAGKKKSGYDGKIAGLYDLEETIGQGHFAVVKLARHVFTGEKVAVKVIDKQKLDDISRSHLFQEVRCMKLVQHPNVVRLYEVIDTQTKLYLILELGDGDMYDYIMKHDKGLDEQLAKKYFRQIVEAILYCHRLHVVHRDLKPENVVFFNKFGIVKLTDFGFSNVFAPGKKLETSCGSLAYSAPEILLGDSYDPPAVDVWSLGVILFMLVAGRAPFQEANDSETLTMIMDCKYQIPSHVSEQCRKLISKMLVREPSHRINLEDIEQDPWLNTDDEPSHQHINLPLLSRDHVSEEDHNYVVQKMVEGKICTREEIFQSLERDAYDHIAATYYLLVERRLRKLQQQEAAAAQSNNLRKQSAPSSSSAIGKPHLEPLMLSPRKQREMKKTKTAPIHQSIVAPPTLIITPPIVGESASQAMRLPVSPGGQEFVKSLTISMTLDRRSGQRKKQQEENVGLTGARSVGTTPGSGAPIILIPDANNKKPQHKVKSAPLTSESGKTSSGKKKSSGPSFSKIAILSSFFERKAAQEAGLIPPAQPHQRLFPWSGGKDRKSKQRIALSPNSPSSLVYSEYEYSPFTRTQSIGSDHFDSSNLVQSLVSPPGTHPSPVSASPKMTHLSPEAMFAAVRKCSLIHEESQDDDDDDDLEDFEIGSELKPSKSLEFLDESGREHSGFEQSNPILVSSGSSHDSVNPRRPLKSVCSSPQLLNQLNQIHEENESEDEDDFVPLKLSAPRGRYSHSGMASPEILRKYEQRRRRKGAGQRGTSCSSSDASDTDDTEGRSRKEKLKHKFMHRRDSSDHSSDTDGPNGGPNSGGHLGSSGAGSKTSHRSRRDGGGGGGGGGGSSKGAGDKSGKSHSKQQHCFLSSDSKSSSEDPVDWPEVNDENIPQHIINIENSHNILSNNKRNQLTRQKPVNGVNGKMGGLGVLEGDFDLIAFSRKLSAISASSVSSGEGSVSSKSSSTKKQLTNCLTSVMVSPAPSPHKIQYIGHCPPQTKDSGSISQSIEFSQISDYCDRLMEDKPKVTICSGDFGLGPASRQAKSSLSGQNGLASTFCKVGSGSQVVQVESKCCSVV
ncbi:SNF-related serine/threonine-protein kinase-like isoform X1 [Biomphalaria glabrata]|uniref:SNF-related serine/threonine-protein kinase n=1 Tax=Biomphalaria glabrata TaxID=6526 RepID=A0A9U8E6I9_BIOGL|nr:SNF-related serine/threonine-protein kinase-like isoform X1 [Biomphalaria glabrata]